MKKISSLFFTICMCLSLCILLNGCGEEAHEHSYGEWVEVKKATCSEKGLKEKLCECGEKIQDDHCFEINGEYVCERCLIDNHRKYTEDLVM